MRIIALYVTRSDSQLFVSGVLTVFCIHVDGDQSRVERYNWESKSIKQPEVLYGFFMAYDCGVKS